MTSAEIRQSFLDFFQSKQHTVVSSSSLLPDAPNLLFTNAGMNQFVPIFLGEQTCSFQPARAADTQKCIRAGGKHNDLEDVGLDTYHHTFFEMLGNWSFGDYFKKEAIEWAWELLTEVWHFPKNRLYATVYKPEEGEPASFDQEAYDLWENLFRKAGLDPRVHVVFGGKKDNFWMMGDTGPCGPCSELHVDLTQNGDTKGRLVNQDSSECIEIWNLVFIQFNANSDGTFTDLPARHVDTGMGFERAVSVMQNTRGFTNFGTVISNYETDIFRPLFTELERMSGRTYRSTLPERGQESANPSGQEKVDVAFRVIADHIRTLSFAIADGIQPGNTDRHYVLRRILRRAVKYGRTLGLTEPFFYKLVPVLSRTMGHVFPEIEQKLDHVQQVIRSEEEAFNRTLDDGLKIFEEIIRLKEQTPALVQAMRDRFEIWRAIEKDPNFKLTEAVVRVLADSAMMLLKSLEEMDQRLMARILQRADIRRLLRASQELVAAVEQEPSASAENEPGQGALHETRLSKAQAFRGAFAEFARVMDSMKGRLTGAAAFLLYDTYGFPLDLTQLLARERGLVVEESEFDRLMEEQRTKARQAQAGKKQVIELSQIKTTSPTRFIGYDQLQNDAEVLEVVRLKDRVAVILDASSCYAEMGGQVGDRGELRASGQVWPIIDTQKSGPAWLHILAQDPDSLSPGATVQLVVDRSRRESIQRHHTVTHLFHWALHEVASREATQKGSFVGPDKLTFDFNSPPLTPGQVADIEKLVNERILDNDPVSWTEVPYKSVADRPDVMQLFGEKYGEEVRVVQIGGHAGRLDGFSMELCGGTHTSATGEIGLFRVVSENAIAAGVRRVEAVAGLEAYQRAQEEMNLIRALAEKMNTPVAELDKKVEILLAQQKELEKQLRNMAAKEAAQTARRLLDTARSVADVPVIIENLGHTDGKTLQAVADGLKGQFKGVIVLAGVSQGSVALLASVAPELTKRFQAGKLIQSIAPVVGGKGGGRPENARGGGKDPSKLDEALRRAASYLEGKAT